MTSVSLQKFLTAALAIPSLHNCTVYAENPQDEGKIRLQYSEYKERGSKQDRMHVKSPMLILEAPVDQKTSFEGTILLDGMSGASPLYLNTISGASGKGITDTRRAGDAKITHIFDSWSLGIGAAYSTEHDYESKGALVEASIWNPSKNTTFALGLSGADDAITSMNNSELNESKRTVSTQTGITQILSPQSLIQSTLSFTSSDGYLSDPYKYFDHRPRSRDSLAALTRYALYFPEEDFSLHGDYRFTHDSWNINSHTFELSIYKPLGERWLIRPNLRYYIQGDASFFTGSFPPPDEERFYSADERLDAFQSITAGFYVERTFDDGIAIDLEVGEIRQQFSAQYLTVGITRRF